MTISSSHSSAAFVSEGFITLAKYVPRGSMHHRRNISINCIGIRLSTNFLQKELHCCMRSSQEELISLSGPMKAPTNFTPVVTSSTPSLSHSDFNPWGGSLLCIHRTLHFSGFISRETI